MMKLPRQKGLKQVTLLAWFLLSVRRVSCVRLWVEGVILMNLVLVSILVYPWVLSLKTMNGWFRLWNLWKSLVLTILVAILPRGWFLVLKIRVQILTWWVLITG